MPDYQPFSEVIEENTGGVSTANATDSFTLFKAKYAGKVTGVSYVPEAASTGDNTNKRTYTLVNKGSDGSGTTVIATLDLTSGNNLVAFDEKAATMHATAANHVFAEGDIIAWVSTHAGTGLVDPGGKVIVTIQRAQG